jgi:2-haloacid dehalogenase
MKLKAVVFDVIETLFDIQPLEEKLTAAGLPGGSLKIWFARLLRDAFALEIAGEYKPFAGVAGAALEAFLREHQIEPERSTINSILKSFGELPAHADVKPAFERLSAPKLPIVPLTNGAAETTKKMFQNAGLENFVERYISIDEVKHWKPAREVYLHAAKTLDIDPRQLLLVSPHDWDIRGARRPGFTTAFVRRKAVFSLAMGKPDISATDLNQLARSLAQLAQS